MSLFDKKVTASTPVINNGNFTATPNVNMVDGLDFAAAQSAQDAAIQATGAATAAAQSEANAANSASQAASSAAQAAASAEQAIDQADGWDEAYAAAQEAIDDAESAVRAADAVYFGFTNMKTTTTTLDPDEPATSQWIAGSNTMAFGIPRGMDGTMEGLADAPIITTVPDDDYVIVVDSSDDSVKKATVDVLLNNAVKTVNGYSPDGSGNVVIPTDDTTPTLYLGETLIGSFGSNPQGAVPADGAIKNVRDFPDIWEMITSGALASVSDQDWLAGTDDVFSQGDNATWFRVPNLMDNGDVVTTNGDYTLQGNITLEGAVTAPLINGNTLHNGDFRMEDTTRNVYTDIALLNRSTAVDDASTDLAAVAFIDRRNNDKYIGGMYTTESDNTVGVQANEGNLQLTSLTGTINLTPVSGSSVIVNGSEVVNGDEAISGDVSISGTTTFTGAQYKTPATSAMTFIGKNNVIPSRGTAGWWKIMSANMPQPSTLALKIYGGGGYNGYPNQAVYSTLVLRTGNGKKALNENQRIGLAFYPCSSINLPFADACAVETSNDNYDIYIYISIYTEGGFTELYASNSVTNLVISPTLYGDGATAPDSNNYATNYYNVSYNSLETGVTVPGAFASGYATMTANDGAVILKNATQDKALYVLARNADSSNRWYVGNGSDNVDDVTFQSYAANNYINLKADGRIILTTANDTGIEANNFISVTSTPGGGGWNQQYNTYAPYYNEFADTGSSVFHPLWKQKDLTNKGMWVGGTLVSADEFHINFVNEDETNTQFTFHANGTFAPASYANFDARYVAVTSEEAMLGRISLLEDQVKELMEKLNG